MGRQDVDRAVWVASSDIAEAVAEAVSAREIGQLVMNAVDRMIGCDLGSILTVAPGEDWSIAGEIADNRPVQQNYWRYTREMSADEMQRMTTGRFMVAEEVFEPRRREVLGIFREVLDPNGLRRIALRQWMSDGRAFGFGLTRTRRQFSDRERARLDALFPYIRAAIRASAWRVEDADGYPGAGAGGPWGLTPAQERVMSLVVRGLTNNEVAGLLGTSPNTVRNTLAEVFKKVGVSRRSELAFIVSRATTQGPADADAQAAQRRFFAAIAEKARAAPLERLARFRALG